MKRGLWAVFFSMLVIGTSGCIFLAAGAAGVGTAKWMSDKVTADSTKPVEKVTSAAKEVFKDLNLKLTKEAGTPEVTQLQGIYSDGRKVWVDIRPLTNGTSKVDVRVGWMNGANDARALRDKIIQKADSWI